MSTDERNKYRDVLITARRARQLQGGASPQVPSKSMKVCRVAQEEIREGKVTYVVPQKRDLPPPSSL